MNDNPSSAQLSETSPSVQTHLGILQNVIDRMAANSASCKAWCITLVSAILVVAATENKPNMVFVTFLPAFLFMILDSYYLALEKGFRNAYCDFVRKVHMHTLRADDLYEVKISGDMFSLRKEAFQSLSIPGFYVGLAALIIVTRFAALE